MRIPNLQILLLGWYDPASFSAAKFDAGTGFAAMNGKRRSRRRRFSGLFWGATSVFPPPASEKSCWGRSLGVKLAAVGG